MIRDSITDPDIDRPTDADAIAPPAFFSALQRPLAAGERDVRDRTYLGETVPYRSVTYDPQSGAMTPKPKLRFGVAVIPVDGRLVRADRIAWRKQGLVPPTRMRHRDSDPMNLRWDNIGPSKLRDNPDKGITTVEGVNGTRYSVTICPPKWGKPIYLGTFESLADARMERDASFARWKFYMREHANQRPASREMATAILRGRLI